jgi:hypothetical protein
MKKATFPECDAAYQRVTIGASLLSEPFRSDWLGLVLSQLEDLEKSQRDAIRKLGNKILTPEAIEGMKKR